MGCGNVAIATVVVLLVLLAVYMAGGEASGAAETFIRKPWDAAAAMAQLVYSDSIGGWVSDVSIGSRRVKALVSTGTFLLYVPDLHPCPPMAGCAGAVRIPPPAAKTIMTKANVRLGGARFRTDVTGTSAARNHGPGPILGLLSNAPSAGFRQRSPGRGVVDTLSTGCLIFDFRMRSDGYVRLVAPPLLAPRGLTAWLAWLAGGGRRPDAVVPVASGVLVPSATLWGDGLDQTGNYFIAPLYGLDPKTGYNAAGMNFVLFEVGTTLNQVPAPPAGDITLRFQQGGIPMRKTATSLTPFLDLVSQTSNGNGPPAAIGILGNQSLLGHVLVLDSVNQMFAIY